MAFDFKKEYKEFYLPKKQPQIITVPSMNYLSVQGQGDPNSPDGAYQQALQILYALAYTIKMSYKGNHHIEGFFEYVVPPLEGFWWQPGTESVNYADKSTFEWLSVIRLPDFVSEADFSWAQAEAAAKKKLDCSAAKFLTITEGLCVQLMHIGSYDSEPASIQIMEDYLAANGYQTDLTDQHRHHEIYLSDPRRTAPDKLKTVIRHPIKKTE